MARTLYERVGGRPFFDKLVEDFYEGVEAEELLRPLYPTRLERSKNDLAEFLAQYWGGPQSYSERKGHPRLRMRHARFVIGWAEREAWMRCMTSAVEASGADAPTRHQLVEYFDMASTHMINAVEERPTARRIGTVGGDQAAGPSGV